jgi:hypothetical protein
MRCGEDVNLKFCLPLNTMNAEAVLGARHRLLEKDRLPLEQGTEKDYVY